MLIWHRQYGIAALACLLCPAPLGAVDAQPAAVGAGAWTATSTVAAAAGRWNHVAVWTGSRMIVWGGDDNHIDGIIGTGGVYDPREDTWTPTSTAGEPTARENTAGVWTGSRLLVWGGLGWNPLGGVSHFDSGGLYDPAADRWVDTSRSGAPTGRSWHTAVWTGTRMIVWGGGFPPSPGGWGLLATGGLYDPATDTWTATSTVGAPLARAAHTAVWTGSRMIVWGGEVGWNAAGQSIYTNTGGLYDPATNTWTAMSTAGAPSGRWRHAAVWTGSRMIVWGGLDPEVTNTGGIYDPATDTWTPTSVTGAPTPRWGHAAAWTGTALFVWGGGDGTNTGGVYDPAADLWAATTLIAAAPARELASALWTGTAVLVWGGRIRWTAEIPSHVTNTGGLFYPDRVRASLDATGDGTEDVVLRQDAGGLNVMSSDGASLANQAWGSGLPWPDYDVAFADASGDGKGDVVSRNRGNGDVEVYASTGTGFQRLAGTGPGGVWSSGWTAGYDLSLADVTGDGRADLMARDRALGDMYVLPSAGNGFPGTAALWGYGWRSPEYDVYLADVTGDLRADLVARYVGLPNGTVETGDVFVSVSSGTAFGPPARWTYGFSAGYELTLGDVDADGRADLAGRYVGPVFPLGSGGDVWVMRATGTRFSWMGLPYRWSYGWGAGYDVLLRDVTGDGRADLVGRLRRNSELYVAPSTGSRFYFAGAWATGIDPAWQIR